MGSDKEMVLVRIECPGNMSFYSKCSCIHHDSSLRNLKEEVDTMFSGGEGIQLEDNLTKLVGIVLVLTLGGLIGE